MNTIDKLAVLEKLALTDEEKTYISEHIATLEESFATLEGPDTAGIAPLVSVLDGAAPLRADIPAKMLSREELLRNAPEQYEGYIQVPRIIM